MNIEKVIGGFLDFELEKKGNFYHSKGIRVNSGRNALKLLLHSIQPSKIYIPYYICNSIISVIKDLSIPYEEYYLDREMYPILSSTVQDRDYIMVVNYFGICDENVKRVIREHRNVIVDNTQAFFSIPNDGENAFYSPRKFFGVPDGGYVYSEINIQQPNDIDFSYDRCDHLLQRADNRLEDSYHLYQQNELKIENLPIRRMSNLTQRILQNINYEHIAIVSMRNFDFLHRVLEKYNILSIPMEKVNVPMVYPLLIGAPGLRKFLIEQKVFVATYWKDVLGKVNTDSFEYELTMDMIPLPIDQRYGIEEMEYIIQLIEEYLK